MIAIIDYGLGNVKAFANVYKNLNIPVRLANQKSDLSGVEKIILPGVGAFDYAMERLNASGLRKTIEDLVFSKKIPILGICVGMQMLASESEEGKTPGLGWVAGEVKKFDFSKFTKNSCIPHMGWNNVYSTGKNNLMKGLCDDSLFYFLHSYYFECKNREDSIAYAEYGHQFTCAVNYKNIYGVQFHPEKSHQWGVQLLKNFAEL
jgi:glutamine amidotransferase